MSAAETECTGPTALVVTLVAHVGNDTTIPPPMCALHLAVPESPMFYNGRTLLEIAPETAQRHNVIYAGVVSHMQPHQHLASENIAIVAVTVGGGGGTVLVAAESEPCPGSTIKEPMNNSVAGNVVATKRMVSSGVWECWAALTIAARVSRRRGGGAGTVAGGGLFFSLQQDG